ncbi:hypothetical protein SLA2020_242430 [Shorea laevis]
MMKHLSFLHGLSLPFSSLLRNRRYSRGYCPAPAGSWWGLYRKKEGATAASNVVWQPALLSMPACPATGIFYLCHIFISSVTFGSWDFLSAVLQLAGRVVAALSEG